MTLVTPSIIWEATDEELREMIKQAQNELILRHMDKQVDTVLALETYGG